MNRRDLFWALYTKGHCASHFNAAFQIIKYVIADLDSACEMLQCGAHLLKDALTKRTVEAGNERMATPLTAAQVCVL